MTGVAPSCKPPALHTGALWPWPHRIFALVLCAQRKHLIQTGVENQTKPNQTKENSKWFSNPRTDYSTESSRVPLRCPWEPCAEVREQRVSRTCAHSGKTTPARFFHGAVTDFCLDWWCLSASWSFATVRWRMLIKWMQITFIMYFGRYLSWLELHKYIQAERKCSSLLILRAVCLPEKTCFGKLLKDLQLTRWWYVWCSRI